MVAMEGITGWLSFTLIGTQVWWRRPSSTRTCNRRNAETMDTHLCSWNFLVDSKDKIAPAFTWKPIMNRLNTDMVYSSERQIFDIQTRDIMYNPAPTKQRWPLQSVYVPRAMSAGQSCSPGRAPILMEQSKNTVRPGKMWSPGPTDVIQ